LKSFLVAMSASRILSSVLRQKILFSVFVSAISAVAAERPNILFIFADDHTFSALGAMGHPVVKTPNLDRLAAQGTLFTSSYNQGGWHGAICVASRAMLNTGRFLWHSKAEMDRGIMRQNIPPPDSEQRKRYEAGFWSRLLHDHGYETHFAGKWHVDAGCIGARPSLFDHYGTVRPGGMPPTAESSYNRPVADEVDAWSPVDPKFQGHWTGGQHWAEVLANDAIKMLGTAAKSDKPFFMYLAFNSPHDPRQAPQEFLDLYPQEQMDVPANFLPENPFKDPMECPPSLRDEKLAPFPRTEYAVRVHRREYYAIISHMDAQIGRIFDALEKTGKRENTHIIFTADNGLAMGSHGLFGKQNMFEHSAKVPLIVAGPGLPKQKRVDTPVYMQDVMPTTLEMAGKAIPQHVQFKSLLPLLRDERSQQHDAIYSAYQQSQRMVRRGDFKLIAYPKSKTVLLYNLKDDPDEIKNLADQPGHAQIIKDLFAELERLQHETGDSLKLDFEK
jgi:choline-sulfatase